jgi:hypothetical protein
VIPADTQSIKLKAQVLEPDEGDIVGVYSNWCRGAAE